MISTIIAFYRILLSDNYNLKYTYWVGLVSILLILISISTETLILDYKKRISEGKEYNKLFGVFTMSLFILSSGFQTFDIVDKYLHPQRHSDLDNIKMPVLTCMEIYPVSFSKETVDMIFTYLDESK